jgi:uncharacterized membrane protein
LQPRCGPRSSAGSERVAPARKSKGIKGFSVACFTINVIHSTSFFQDAGAGASMVGGIEHGEVSAATAFSLVARRNNSLGTSGRLLAFGIICAVSIGIAAAFAAIGAWPILPFAGAEMLVLFLAFRHVERHAGDCEWISIDGDRLRVEAVEAGRRRRHEFNRCWAQLVVRPDGAGLALRSHGRELAIGRFVDAERRLEMARALERELRAR